MTEKNTQSAEEPHVVPIDGRIVTPASFFFVLVAAVCWVGFALLVAEPNQLTALNFRELATDFARFEKGPSEAITVLVLLLADVTIAVTFLSNEKPKDGFIGPGRIRIAAFGSLVFLVSAIYLPLASKAFAENAFAIGIVAMCALILLRGLSYAPPVRVKEFKPLLPQQ